MQRLAWVWMPRRCPRLGFARFRPGSYRRGGRLQKVVRVRWRLAVALFSWAGLATLGLAQPPRRHTSLEPAVRSRLERSELVTSPIDERRGALRMLGGTSMKVLDFPPRAVWHALETAPDLGQMLPGKTSVVETYRRGHERGALVRHAHGPIEASYHVRITFRPGERTIYFRLDSTYESKLRAGWGFVHLSRWSRGRTLVRFGALVDLGSGLVTGLMRPAVQRAILEVPCTMESYMERSSRVDSHERPASAPCRLGRSPVAAGAAFGYSQLDP